MRYTTNTWDYLVHPLGKYDVMIFSGWYTLEAIHWVLFTNRVERRDGLNVGRPAGVI